MNDLELTLGNLSKLIEEARRDDLTFTEKAGIYAAMDVVAREIDKHIDDDCGGDPYAREKIFKVRWHVGAVLGFDVTNDQSIQQHIVWALGSKDSLRNVLERHKARREKQGEE